VRKPRLVIMDRDGVLNKMVIHAEHGTLDSPMNVSEVQLMEGVEESLVRLTRAGIGLSIATNQPAAAKGKTTRKNLQDIHALIVRRLESCGAIIKSSHICFHRQEDGCECRKPKPGLLLEAVRQHELSATEVYWMVGDGVTDIEAGILAGAKTAFLGSRKADMIGLFEERNVRPDFWGSTLSEFIDFLLGKPL